MTVEQRPLIPEFNGWAEATKALKDRYQSLGKKLYAFKNVSPGDFNPTVYIDHGPIDHGPYSLMISTTISHEDVLQAPQEIQRVLNDLGLTDVNQIHLSIYLEDISKNAEYSHNFQILLAPDELTPERLGIALTNNGRNRVMAPTERAFDGVHQFADSRYGKGAQMADLYERDLENHFGTAHPYMVSILEAGENWVIDIINSKRRNPSPVETSTKSS